MTLKIDDRLLALIGFLLMIVGLIMAVVSVSMAVFNMVSLVYALIVSIIAGALMVILPLIFYREVFFWIVWIVLVAFFAIPAFGWWSLIILGGLVSLVIFVVAG